MLESLLVFLAVATALVLILIIAVTLTRGKPPDGSVPIAIILLVVLAWVAWLVYNTLGLSLHVVLWSVPLLGLVTPLGGEGMPTNLGDLLKQLRFPTEPEERYLDFEIGEPCPVCGTPFAELLQEKYVEFGNDTVGYVNHYHHDNWDGLQSCHRTCEYFPYDIGSISVRLIVTSGQGESMALEVIPDAGDPYNLKLTKDDLPEARLWAGIVQATTPQLVKYTVDLWVETKIVEWMSPARFAEYRAS